MPTEPEDSTPGQVRKTISLDAHIYEAALAHARARGFSKSFSAYVAWLIERDTAGDVSPQIPRSGKVSYLRAAEGPPGE